MFIFDTDHLSFLQREDRGPTPSFDARLAGHTESDFWITIVSFHEQFLGWKSYLSKARGADELVLGYARLEALLASFSGYQILSFDEAAAEVFFDLRKRRVRIGTMDLRIAAIAIANDMTLLTRNTVDSERVPGLTFEDWT
jgi:tRNA(fMet)-specific endonuclease VapC